MNDTPDHILKAIDALPEPMRAAILASIVAMVRVMYDGKEPRWVRRFLESVLCGLIALGISHLIQAIGMPDGWSTFLGASVGLFGADKVREWGQRFAQNKGL
jgi:lambda family phage holin